MKSHLENRTFGMTVSKSDHSRGPADAPILLIQYGDYECHDCVAGHWIISTAQQELGVEVRFVFRHFPQRDLHPRAQRAAEAAEAAAAQRRFWDMHDLLFDHPHALTNRQLREYAAALGLDAVRFDCELAARIYAKRVRDHARNATIKGIERAPTFFINGVRYDGACDLRRLLSTLQPLVAA
jgi:protein-disulfide isomerase